MGGLTLTLDTAAQTLLNTQIELQTSSHNIANANNAWYSRQTAVQQDNPAYRVDGGWIGTGASIAGITQMRDQFLEGQLMNATSSNSQYTSLSAELTAVQASASDSGSSGISQALGAFYNAWDTLSRNPAGMSEQSGVYQAAQTLASNIQSTYNRLNQIYTGDIPGKINDTVTNANSLIDKIAQLNTAIAQNETPGVQANDLRDERYKAMDDLSKLIPVSFSTDSSGSTVTVTTTETSGPVTIVSGGVGTHIAIPPAPPAAPTVTGGKLGGLLQVQTDLKGYMDRLNTFTSSLVSQVNTLHGAGADATLTVFTDTAGSEASSIAASTTFLNGAGAAPANESTRALSLANLQGNQVSFSDGKKTTLQGYLSDVQQQIGTDVLQANTNASFNQSLQAQLQSQQQALSGVSMDEEMVNVIQYQQIYQAAAKVVSTASALMSTAIAMVQ